MRDSSPLHEVAAIADSCVVAHELDTVHVGHLQIAEYQVDLIGLGFQERDGVTGAVAQHDPNAPDPLQLPGEQLESKGIVVDERCLHVRLCAGF